MTLTAIGWKFFHYKSNAHQCGAKRSYF